MDNLNTTTPRLLVVDDEPGVLTAVERLFHDEPYEILTALDGSAALELLRRSDPVHVVISDFRMPGMNGVEFLQQVTRFWPDARRVILSASPDTDVLLAAVNEGRVHRFITKPWNNDSLKSVVRELLDEYRMLMSFRLEAEELARNNRLLSRTNEHLSAILTDVLANMRRGSTAEDAYSPFVSPPPEQHPFEILSPREREIMYAITSGHSLKAVAMDLNLSIKTISTYKKRLFDKMGFKSDAELICYTLKHNLHK